MNKDEMKENFKKVPKPLKIIFYVLLGIIVLGIIGGLMTDTQSENGDEKNPESAEKEKPKKEEKEFKCNDSGDYETEYNLILEKLYPYGYKVSRILDYTTVREEEKLCMYRTTIKIKNAYGAEQSATMYITTDLDKANKKETLSKIMVDNIYVYEK